VAQGLSPTELNKLARRGAAARLAELEREIAALRRAFPGLTPASAGAVRPGRPEGQGTKLSSRMARRGRRKPMSAPERQAVSERMKRYWAERRTSKG
jgi:hypothetical protein